MRITNLLTALAVASSLTLFCGCGTALVTPFRGGRVDFDALENLID